LPQAANLSPPKNSADDGQPGLIAMDAVSTIGGYPVLKSNPVGLRLNRFDLPQDKITALALNR
jgi:hypothetical protein